MQPTARMSGLPGTLNFDVSAWDVMVENRKALEFCAGALSVVRYRRKSQNIKNITAKMTNAVSPRVNRFPILGLFCRVDPCAWLG